MIIMSDFLFSKEIYKEGPIEMAVEAYSGIARITIIEDPYYWNITFENCVYDEQLTVHEFENYLLGVEATIRRKDDL